MSMTTDKRHDPRFDAIRRLGGERYEAFLAAGYREWYSPGCHMTPFLLQKAIPRPKPGILYFIDVWAYDASQYRPGFPATFQFECQFEARSDERPTFSVTLHDRDHSPEQVEAFFAAIYSRMDCGPYDDEV